MNEQVPIACRYLSTCPHSDRKGLAKTIVCDQGDKDCEPFWTALGDKGAVATAAAGGADSAATAPKKLFRLSDATATLTFTEVACGRVLRSQFDSKDVFVYDNGMEVFVWVGSKATAQEKAKGLQYAQDYLGKYGRPAWLPISKVVEGGESEVFVKSLDG